MVGSVPTLYKNQPLRGLWTVMYPKRHISKFASHANSSWSARVEFSLPTQLWKKRKFAPAKMPWFGKSYSTASAGANCNPDLPQDSSMLKGFDICLPGSKTLPRHTRNPKIPSHSLEWSILRPGMVLMKHFFDENDQIKMVRTCRPLGVGPGGFYRLADKDGAKLDLQMMMCLGLNWNPERLTYEFIRLREDASIEKSVDVFPPMCALACIINFYSAAATGRLALHQDCSERSESLRRGSPVISISVGDAAEFLYGDESDASKAKKVVLESGDALIFATKSKTHISRCKLHYTEFCS